MLIQPRQDGRKIATQLQRLLHRLMSSHFVFARAPLLRKRIDIRPLLRKRIGIPVANGSVGNSLPILPDQRLKTIGLDSRSCAVISKFRINILGPVCPCGGYIDKFQGAGNGTHPPNTGNRRSRRLMECSQVCQTGEAR
ncbi:hypothetical protein GCM10023192_56740 [Amycolatopsis samaneae]